MIMAKDHIIVVITAGMSFFLCLPAVFSPAPAYSATIVNQPITQNSTWNVTNSPYIVIGAVSVNSGGSNPITLTIEPGVEIRFDNTYMYQGSQLSFGDKGRLFASGTAAQPVNFTSNSTMPQAGDWSGLNFNSPLANAMENCTVAYGGAGGSNGFNVNCAGNTNLTLRNCVIRGSLHYGLLAGYSAAPVLVNSTFADNQGIPAEVPAQAVGDISGAVFSNNTNNVIVVKGNSVAKNATWRNHGIPYVVKGGVFFLGQPSAPVTLTIEPDTVVKFSKEMTGYLTIGVEPDVRATLIARGNASAPIIFTSDNATPAPGDWGAITFTRAAVNSALEYCTIEYAGSTALHITNSSPVIRNCTIRNNAGTAIYMQLEASPVIENSTITGNAEGIRCAIYDAFPLVQYNTISGNSRGIRLDWRSSTPSQRPVTIRNNNIFNNSVYNVDNHYTSFYGFDVRLNWWGNVSNPAGRLNGLLIYEPWLNQTFTRPFNFKSAAVNPREFTQNGSAAAFTGTLSAPGNWTIEIKNSTGAVVRAINGAGTAVQQNWDGRNQAGQALADGIYTYLIRATAVSGGQTAASAAGNITLIAALPIAKINSPRMDAVIQSGDNVTITGSANATGGAVLQSYTVEYGAGTMPAGWSTITTGYSAVINGTLATWSTGYLTEPVYTLRLTVTDSNNRTAVDSVTVILTSDTTPPAANITAPAHGTLVTQEVNITGTAADANFDHYDLYYGAGSSPSSWNAITQGYSAVNNGLLGTWNTTGLNDSFYTVKLVSFDRAGNNAGDYKTYNVSNVAITNVSVSPDFFDPHAGETVSINYTIDKASNVTIHLYNFTGFFAHALITNASRTAGPHTQIWNGKNGTNITVGDDGYKFIIEAYAASGARGHYQPQWHSVGPNLTDVRITESFDPYQSEICNITYTLAHPQYVSLILRNESNISAPVISAVRPRGVNSDYADSRMTHGTLVTGSLSVKVFDTVQWWDNMIVTGAARAPLGFNSDPYCIFPVYGDIANVSYTLSAEAVVTARVYAQENIYTPIATLLNAGVRSAGNHTVEWDGRADNGTVAAKGDYSLIIEANQTSGGRVRTRRGNISIR